MPLVPPPAVVVIYDKGNLRAERKFTNPYHARAFYVAKLKAGKNPVVKKVGYNDK